MTNDYIRREDAVDAMGKAQWAKDRLLDIEPADVAPVVHGEYVGEYDGYADGYPVCDMWYCSVCGCHFEDWDEKPTYNYCPQLRSKDGWRGVSMTGGDLLLKIGFEGVRKNPDYMSKMRGKLMNYDIRSLRCVNCKHDYNNPNDVVCMVCPVFILATSEFLYEKFG